jgi:hypothetical protein
METGGQCEQRPAGKKFLDEMKKEEEILLRAIVRPHFTVLANFNFKKRSKNAHCKSVWFINRKAGCGLRKYLCRQWSLVSQDRCAFGFTDRNVGLFAVVAKPLYLSQGIC